MLEMAERVTSGDEGGSGHMGSEIVMGSRRESEDLGPDRSCLRYKSSMLIRFLAYAADSRMLHLDGFYSTLNTIHFYEGTSSPRHAHSRIEAIGP